MPYPAVLAMPWDEMLLALAESQDVETDGGVAALTAAIGALMAGLADR